MSERLFPSFGGCLSSNYAVVLNLIFHDEDVRGKLDPGIASCLIFQAVLGDEGMMGEVNEAKCKNKYICEACDVDVIVTLKFYWKCNFPMTSPVHSLVGRLAVRLVGLSVDHKNAGYTSILLSDYLLEV